MTQPTPHAPGWHTLWGTYRGGRVGVEFCLKKENGGRFLTLPIGIVAGNPPVSFPFPEEYTLQWVDFTPGLTDDAIATLIEIAGFSAHDKMRIAFLAQQKEA